ncbi:hypothetical protein [Staphylococcus phage ZCSS1]|nr:hypothetical protein [Staphylococcus phage ZCSS1]
MHKKYYKGLKLNDFEKEVFGLKKSKDYKKLNKKLGRNEPMYWNFDSSFFIQLYADLNAFIDSSERACVDSTYLTFKDTRGVERTEIEMIEHIKSLIIELHETEFDYGKTYDLIIEEHNREKELIKDILMNLAIIMPSLWN